MDAAKVLFGVALVIMLFFVGVGFVVWLNDSGNQLQKLTDCGGLTKDAVGASQAGCGVPGCSGMRTLAGSTWTDLGVSTGCKDANKPACCFAIPSNGAGSNAMGQLYDSCTSKIGNDVYSGYCMNSCTSTQTETAGVCKTGKCCVDKTTKLSPQDYSYVQIKDNSACTIVYKNDGTVESGSHCIGKKPQCVFRAAGSNINEYCVHRDEDSAGYCFHLADTPGHSMQVSTNLFCDNQ